MPGKPGQARRGGATDKGARGRGGTQRVITFDIGGRVLSVRLGWGAAESHQREGALPDVSDLAPLLPPAKRTAKRVLESVLTARMMFSHLTAQLASDAEAFRSHRKSAESALAELVASSGRAWICVDCAFDGLMTPAELRSLRDQITRGYARVRGLPEEEPLPLVLAGVSDELILALLQSSCASWAVRITRLPWSSLALHPRPAGALEPGAAAAAAASSEAVSAKLTDPLRAPDIRDELLRADGSVAIKDPTKTAHGLRRRVEACLAQTSAPASGGARGSQSPVLAGIGWGAQSVPGFCLDASKSSPPAEAEATAGAASSADHEQREDEDRSPSAEELALAPIYLTADAERAVAGDDDQAWPGRGTVIGGLVDRSRHVGATLRVAERGGAMPMRLPLERFIQGTLSARRVLTTKAVMEIVAGRTRGLPWRDLLRGAIPQRKGKRMDMIDDPSDTGDDATPVAAAEPLAKRQRAADAGDDEDDAV